MTRKKIEVTDLSPLVEKLRVINQRLVEVQARLTLLEALTLEHDKAIPSHPDDRQPNTVVERIDKLSVSLQETLQLLERLEARIASNELNIDHLKTELL